MAEILLNSLVRQVRRNKRFNGAATNTGQFKDSRDWVEIERFMNEWNVSVIIADSEDPNVAGSWVSSRKTIYLAGPTGELRLDDRKTGLSGALSDAVRNNSWDTFANKMGHAYLDTLIHELTHAFDDFRSSGKFMKDTYTADVTSKDYWLDQIEINARFAETSSRLQRQKLKLDTGHGFEEYMRLFKAEIKSWEDMPEWVQKRLVGRMFKEYSELSNEDKDRLLVRESYAVLNDAIQKLAAGKDTQLPEELIWASADARLRGDKAYSQNQIHTLGKILGDAARNPGKYETGEFKWARYLLDTIQESVKKNPEIRDAIQRYFSFSDEEMERISAMDAWWESMGEVDEARKLDIEDLPLTSATYQGVHFETGKAVEFPFIRNNESSKNYKTNQDFQQGIEPSGKYVSFDDDPQRKLPDDRWGRGTARLENPLVLGWNGRYDESSWKAALYRVFKRKGASLRVALQARGYDGVVTLDGGEPTEIVLLTVPNPETVKGRDGDHGYHPIPRVCRLLGVANRIGIDVAGRAVYGFDDKRYSWDSLHGEWEVFRKSDNKHLGAIRDFGDKFHKDDVPGRWLEMG